MPDLLGIDFAEVIGDAFEGQLLPATLTQVVVGDLLNGSTGGRSRTETEHKTEGVVESYGEYFLQGTQIQAGDRKIRVLAAPLNGSEPKPGDKIAIDGGVYEAISVKADPAKAMWTIQGRRV